MSVINAPLPDIVIFVPAVLLIDRAPAVTVPAEMLRSPRYELVPRLRTLVMNRVPPVIDTGGQLPKFAVLKESGKYRIPFVVMVRLAPTEMMRLVAGVWG